MNSPLQHWNPRAPEVLADQARAYDRMRDKHPVAYCPGASLARMEMRIDVEALLNHSQRLRLGRRPPLRAVFPANGYRQLHVRLD